VQTSAVNYVVQRMTILSAFFALAAVLLADRYFLLSVKGKAREAGVQLCLSVLCGILSVMAKENTVLLPLMVFLLAWLRGQGRLAKGWKIALLMWSIVPLVALCLQILDPFSSAGRLGSVPLYQDTGKVYYESLKDRSFLPLRYFLSQLEVFWVYLGLLFLPLWQGFDYCWPIPEFRLSPLHVGTFILWIAIGWFSFRRRDRFPLTFFGIGWIFIFMVVESSFIPLDPIFEHRLYLAIVGVILILYEQVFRRLDKNWGTTLFAVALAFCILLTWKRNAEWGGAVAFLTANTKVVDRAPRPNLYLANALFTDKHFAEAADILKKFSTTFPTHFDMILGEALYFAGEHAQGMDALRKASMLEPSENRVELFEGYTAIGEGRLEDADKWLDQAELKKKKDVLSLYLKGELAERRGALLSAIEMYQKAIYEYQFYPKNSVDFDIPYVTWAMERREALLRKVSGWLSEEYASIAADPENLNRRGAFANQLLVMGLYDEAIGQYEVLKKKAPEIWPLFYNLGIAYEKVGKCSLATKSYQDGLRLAPNRPELLLNYGLLLQRKGENAQARVNYEKLLQQAPDDGRVWLVYGELLADEGEVKRATEVLLKAASLPGYGALARAKLKTLNRSSAEF